MPVSEVNIYIVVNVLSGMMGLNYFGWTLHGNCIQRQAGRQAWLRWLLSSSDQINGSLQSFI